MAKTRFLMIGGFLGAGKTTAIARLARQFIDAGSSVGLVTNDQAHDLVDTHTLRSQGFDVGEVPGACFCCKFDDLVDTAAGLTKQQMPDVIIAEPVGSCTDLAATVIEPLRHLHGDQYEVGSLAVLLKPEHGQKILRQGDGRGFSPKAEYIFLKQIEEADIVAVNKVDKLSGDEVDELTRLISERYLEKLVLAVSGRDGTNFPALFDALQSSGPTARERMEIDYTTYAEGEAELGWLNCVCRFQGDGDKKFAVDDVVLGLVERLRTMILDADAEAAHLKVFADAAGAPSVANLVSSEAAAELSMACETQLAAADLVVNARVALDPEILEDLVRSAAAAEAAAHELTHEITGMQRFRPAPPVPTHGGPQ